MRLVLQTQTKLVERALMYVHAYLTIGHAATLDFPTSRLAQIRNFPRVFGGLGSAWLDSQTDAAVL